MANKERRTARRFRMKLPISLTWASGSGNGRVETETSEVSSRGVCFYADSSLRSGTPVEFQMTLPHEITMAGPVRVRCLGRVVRADSLEEHKVGIAVAIERYEFMRGEQNDESSAA